jgi:hypothetical protein
MTIRHCVGITPNAARKGRGQRAGDVHHLEMDVVAAAQDGEQHPLGTPVAMIIIPLLGRTAKAAIVAALREVAG